jgi:hypothetical protein
MWARELLRHVVAVVVTPPDKQGSSIIVQGFLPITRFLIRFMKLAMSVLFHSIKRNTVSGDVQVPSVFTSNE